MSYLVLLSDPDPRRRASIEHALSARFEVLAVGQSQLAIALFRSRKPFFFVASARQSEFHGFRLCSAMRRIPGSQGRHMVVYGPQPGFRPADRRTIQSRFRVDHWLVGEGPRGPYGAQLVELLERLVPQSRSEETEQALEVARRRQQRVFSARVEPREETWGDILNAPVSGESLKDLLTRPIGADKELAKRPLQERSFMELLRSDASLPVLSELVTRPVPGTVAEVPQEVPPERYTWGQLLNAPVSWATVRALLTREISLGGSEEPQPIEPVAPPIPGMETSGSWEAALSGELSPGQLRSLVSQEIDLSAQTASELSTDG